MLLPRLHHCLPLRRKHVATLHNIQSVFSWYVCGQDLDQARKRLSGAHVVEERLLHQVAAVRINLLGM